MIIYSLISFYLHHSKLEFLDKLVYLEILNVESREYKQS